MGGLLRDDKHGNDARLEGVWGLLMDGQQSGGDRS